MFITDLLKLTHKCKHEHVTPDRDCAYCPDCGKLIKNEWYITRCACCGVKLKTTAKNGVVMPQLHYCANCGSDEYKIEKLDEINFVDINFAALVKRIVEDERKIPNSTTCWQERTSLQPKLLVQYL